MAFMEIKKFLDQWQHLLHCMVGGKLFKLYIYKFFLIKTNKRGHNLLGFEDAWGIDFNSTTYTTPHYSTTIDLI